MTYHCLCLAPAVDVLVRLPHAPAGIGEIFKNVVDETNAGGKALNVARWLARRGARVACGGFVGADDSDLFAQTLAAAGVEDRFVRVKGPTRRNEMVTWPGGSFKINRAAFPDLRADAFSCVNAFPGVAELGADDVVVLSGSLPSRFPAAYYARLVAQLRDRVRAVVLDASGDALVEGVKACPHLVKPNAEECAPIVGFVPKAPDDFRRANDRFRALGVKAIISDGASGAWFDGTFVPAPAVDVVDTTAAGDTLLAEWCFSHNAARAVVAGSAACTMPGSRPPPLALVDELLKGMSA